MTGLLNKLDMSEVAYQVQGMHTNLQMRQTGSLVKPNSRANEIKVRAWLLRCGFKSVLSGQLSW